MAVTYWDPAVRAIEPGVAALGLVSRLDDGNPLPVLGDPLDVDGEVVHADVWLCASWFGPTDVAYDEFTFVDFGGWLRLAVSAATSAVGHRRQRTAASAVAAPQWRPLGDAPVRAVLTERRLVLEHDEGAIDITYDDVEVVADFVGCRTELHAEGEAPVALEGPWVPYLTVALVHLVTGGVLPKTALTAGLPSPLRFSRRP